MQQRVMTAYLGEGAPVRTVRARPLPMALPRSAEVVAPAVAAPVPVAAAVPVAATPA